MTPMRNVPYVAFSKDSVRTGHDAQMVVFAPKNGNLAIESGVFQRDFLGESHTCGGSTPTPYRKSETLNHSTIATNTGAR